MIFKLIELNFEIQIIFCYLLINRNSKSFQIYRLSSKQINPYQLSFFFFGTYVNYVFVFDKSQNNCVYIVINLFTFQISYIQL